MANRCAKSSGLGAWRDQEWAKAVLEAYWPQGTGEAQMQQYDMPRVEAEVGMVSYFARRGNEDEEQR
jgi:hypothetical protein